MVINRPEPRLLQTASTDLGRRIAPGFLRPLDVVDDWLTLASCASSTRLAAPEAEVRWGDWMSRLGGVLLVVWGAPGLVRMICN